MFENLHEHSFDDRSYPFDDLSNYSTVLKDDLNVDMYFDDVVV